MAKRRKAQSKKVSGELTETQERLARLEATMEAITSPLTLLHGADDNPFANATIESPSSLPREVLAHIEGTAENSAEAEAVSEELQELLEKHGYAVDETPADLSPSALSSLLIRGVRALETIASKSWLDIQQDVAYLCGPPLGPFPRDYLKGFFAETESLTDAKEIVKRLRTIVGVSLAPSGKAWMVERWLARRCGIRLPVKRRQGGKRNRNGAP